MKKIIAFLLTLTTVFALASCVSDPAENDGQTQGDGAVPDGATTDEDKLRSAVSCRVDVEGHVVISIKTSANIKMDSGWLGICPMGIYPTEEAADAADVYYEKYVQSNDPDGIYTFVLMNDDITPDTYTMVLCDDDDSGNVIGEWIFNKTRNGTIELGFDGAWLTGAGED